MKSLKTDESVPGGSSGITCLILSVPIAASMTPAVLTFDHIRGKKKKDVSKMVAEGYSIEAIQQEIGKCEIVCANCHMRREQRRAVG